MWKKKKLKVHLLLFNISIYPSIIKEGRLMSLVLNPINITSTIVCQPMSSHNSTRSDIINRVGIFFFRPSHIYQYLFLPEDIPHSCLFYFIFLFFVFLHLATLFFQPLNIVCTYTPIPILFRLSLLFLIPFDDKYANKTEVSSNQINAKLTWNSNDFFRQRQC